MLFARRPFALVAGVALCAAAACGDSTAPDATLTDDEAIELARQMEIHFTGGFSSSTAPEGAGVQFNTVPEPFNVPVDVSVPCPRGGNTRLTGTVSGTMDEATESLTAHLNGTHRPTNCGYDVHGKTISISGSLTTTAHVEVANGVPIGRHAATLVGEFNWRASDGRRGTCAVDITSTANFSSRISTLTGTLCGSPIQLSRPLAAP